MDSNLLQSLSPEMRAYFISQTDPFHDNPFRLEGAPSSLSASSMVMTVNSEVTLNATSFGLPVTEGAKFDMHVALLPISAPVQVNGANTYLPGSFRNATAAYVTNLNLFPLTVHGVPSGAQTFKWASSLDTPGFQGLPNDYPLQLVQAASSGFCGRAFREIGRSFEIVDQTAKMYQQGSFTVYEFSSEGIDRQTNFAPIANSTTTTVTNNRNSTYTRVPATSLGQATRTPGSKTWEASQGVYCVARKNVEEIPYSTLTAEPIVFVGEPDGVTPVTGTSYKSFVTTAATTQAPTSNSMSAAATPYQGYGAYGTGLSSQYGNFRIRLKQIFEILAAPSDTDILPLMSPTIPRNPEVEYLIEQVLKSTPAFQQQTMNPKGEAWKVVLRTAGRVIKELAPVANSFLPGSEAPLRMAGEAAIKQGRKKARPKTPAVVRVVPKGTPTATAKK